MKLRIRDNSVRLRLSPSEVAGLGRDGLVSARTVFPGGRTFDYVVESSPASVTPEAFFSNNVMTLRLPESMVLAWVSSGEIAMSGEQPLGDGRTLSLLVEKDFACLVPRPGEDDSDLYPHPEAGAGRS